MIFRIHFKFSITSLSNLTSGHPAPREAASYAETVCFLNNPFSDWSLLPFLILWGFSASSYTPWFTYKGFVKYILILTVQKKETFFPSFFCVYFLHKFWNITPQNGDNTKRELLQASLSEKGESLGVAPAGLLPDLRTGRTEAAGTCSSLALFLSLRPRVVFCL